jgi:SAM-dependent methyltransferase
MHETSFMAMKHLLERLVPRQAQISVLDVGSQIAEAGHTSYRDIVESMEAVSYTGLDVAPGRNVDVVATDAYKFPLPSDAFDVVISGQAFEHIEFPWLTMLEIARVLKPGGLSVVIAPSSGQEHRYPQDCWRFYPDSMRALAKWAKLDCVAALTNWPETRLFLWGDTVGVFYKRRSPDEVPQLPDLELERLQSIYRSLLRFSFVDSLRTLRRIRRGG